MPRPMLVLTASLLLTAVTACGGASAPSAKAPAKKAEVAPETGKATPKAVKPEPRAAKKAAVRRAAATPAALGEPAPDFELADLDGNKHKLSDHQGKIVVLEWFNPKCPFVEYAHAKGPLSTMAKDTMGDDLVWLSINSGAPGKQGHGVETNRAGVEAYNMTNPVLLDESGEVGRLYGAIKTPHIFIVAKDGTLAYRGGLDNAPIGEVDGGGEHVNYVADALANVRAGQPVAVPEPRPYGCTVKYAS